MAAFDQPQNRPPEPEDSRDMARQARWGLVLFAVYLAFYAGFVLLNTFRPQAMGAAPLFGVSLAVLYGFALIGAALVLAGIYEWLCRGGRRSRDGEGAR
jgi:uncharacterized membrane protein (DUF485 family)